MHCRMRNDAIKELPEAYPQTLAQAFRIASNWTNDEPGAGFHALDNHSAYLTDTAFVTKARDPDKPTTKPVGESTKSGSRNPKKSTEVICYVCGVVEHYARDCALKKGHDKALVVSKRSGDTDDDEDIDEWEEGTALIMREESCLFSKFHVLLDNQSSVNVFKNPDLLTDMRKSSNNVVVNGVQRGAKGVKIDMEGNFQNLGAVYFSPDTTANILSFAAQTDAGAEIRYNSAADNFTLKGKNSGDIFTFARQRILEVAGASTHAT